MTPGDVLAAVHAGWAVTAGCFAGIAVTLAWWRYQGLANRRAIETVTGAEVSPRAGLEAFKAELEAIEGKSAIFRAIDAGYRGLTYQAARCEREGDLDPDNLRYTYQSGVAVAADITGYNPAWVKSPKELISSLGGTRAWVEFYRPHYERALMLANGIAPPPVTLGSGIVLDAVDALARCDFWRGEHFVVQILPDVETRGIVCASVDRTEMDRLCAATERPMQFADGEGHRNKAAPGPRDGR